MADSLSERDELTLRTLALLERTTLVEQRRQALRAYAAQARQDEGVAEIVPLMLASRRERENGGGNVIRMPGPPGCGTGRTGGSPVKIRLWGTAAEYRQMAQLLIDAPGFEVVSVSEPYADRGASVLMRVFVEARLDPPPVHSTAPPVLLPAGAPIGRSRREMPG